MNDSSPPSPEDSVGRDELARRAIALVEKANAEGVPLRIVGGTAVRILCPDLPAREADDQDLDLACASKHSKALSRCLEEEGLAPDTHFNAVHGRSQLRFGGNDGLHVDVLLDKIAMSHELDLRKRLELAPQTLEPTDLLLSKLQIAEINEKDVHDAALLLASHRLAEAEGEGAISRERFGDVVGSDWGWWRTVTGNLELLAERPAEELPVPGEAATEAQARAAELRQFADEVPKTIGWKMRAKVGERVRWYEVPEEVDEA